MAEVTKELIYHTLKQIQGEIDSLICEADEAKAQVHALRTHFVAIAQDIQNIYGILVRHDARLDRIERRLEIAEVPA